MRYLVVILLLFSQSDAASLYCRGKITNAYISSSGMLVVRATYRDDYTQICSLKDDPVKCSMWGSLITNSITSDKEVIIAYSASSYDSCAVLPTYSGAPMPSYVMLVR